MAGPKKADEALLWIQEAFQRGRYVPSVHFGERLVERKVTMMDVHHAIAQADEIREYTRGEPEHGGTCWRVTGPSLNDDDENLIAVGIEAFLHKRRHRVVMCTVFRPDEE